MHFSNANIAFSAFSVLFANSVFIESNFLYKVLYGEAPPQGPTLTLFYTILTEKVSLSYTFNWKKVPLSHAFITGHIVNKSPKKEILSFSSSAKPAF